MAENLIDAAIKVATELNRASNVEIDQVQIGANTITDSAATAPVADTVVEAAVKTAVESTPTIPADASTSTTPTTPTTPTTSSTNDIKPKPAIIDLSHKFAILTQQQKRLNQQSEQIKSANELLQQQTAQLKALTEQLHSGDPVAALEKLGVDFNALSKRLLGTPVEEKSELVKLQKELNAVKADQVEAARIAKEQNKKFEESKIKDTYQKQEQDFRQQIQLVIKKEPEFEFCREFDATNDIFDVIVAHFEQHQEILDIKDAAQMVEKYHENIAVKAKAALDKKKATSISAIDVAFFLSKAALAFTAIFS